MNYCQCRAYLQDFQAFGSHYGLDVIGSLLHSLKWSDQDLEIVHVAGTNGKGSVIAFLTSILRAAAIEVSSYTSPEVVDYLDRFRINGLPVSPEDFAKACARVTDAANELAKQGPRHASLFEMELAIALLLAQASPAKLFIQETGLGGRLDATNAVAEPALILMTPLALDHMDLLGTDLAAIAREKAGIFKAGCRILSAPQPPEVRTVFKERAQELACPLTILEEEAIQASNGELLYQDQSYALSLRGAHQRTNAALAIEAARVLLPDTASSEAAIRQGLAQASWPGRLEILEDRPRIYLDGAHNPAAARALAAYLAAAHPDQRIVGLGHFYRDKDAAGILDALAPLLALLELPELGYDRSLPAEEAARLAEELLPPEAIRMQPSLEAAMSQAFVELRADDVFVIFGSLSHLQAARTHYLAIKERGNTP